MSVQLDFLLIGIVFFIGIESKLLSTPELTDRINHLLDITETEKKFNNVLNTYVTSDPNLSVHKSEVLKFFNKFLSYQLLRPHLVEIHSDYYTLSDINEIIEFYSSSIGTKLIETTDKIQNQLQEQISQITTWFQKKHSM